jgi:hypothetical protein
MNDPPSIAAVVFHELPGPKLLYIAPAERCDAVRQMESAK